MAPVTDSKGGNAGVLDARRPVVVVGTSWGGLAALGEILERLPESFALPIVVVQHRGPTADETMREVLQARCVLPVREVEDKEPMAPGHVYLAPPDYHLLVEDGYFALSVDEPVAFSRPSIDVLFESAAYAYGRRVVGVLLTGANDDGSRGLAVIKRAGGMVIVQDPATAEIPTMPEKGLAAVLADHVASLEEIAAILIRLAEARAPTLREERAS